MWKHNYEIKRNDKVYFRYYDSKDTDCFHAIDWSELQEDDTIELLVWSQKYNSDYFSKKQCLEYLNLFKDISVIGFEIIDDGETIMTKHTYKTYSQTWHSLIIVRILCEDNNNEHHLVPKYVLDNQSKLHPFYLLQLGHIFAMNDYSYNSGHAFLYQRHLPLLRSVEDLGLLLNPNQEWSLNEFYSGEVVDMDKFKKITDCEELFKKVKEYAKN